MEKGKIKKIKRDRRRSKIRSKIFGTVDVPRCSVYKSLNNISVQLIDDNNSKTLLSFSSLNLKDIKKKTKKELAFEVGEGFGKLAVSKGFEGIIFDRNGFLYHGRVKSLADGIRKAGIKF